MDFLKSYRAARRVATPLIAVRTPDAASTIQAVVGAEDAAATPIIHWDIMRGLVGVNARGQKAADLVLDGGSAAMASARPTDALTMAQGLPEDSVLFFANAHRYLQDAAVAQAVWNLRDAFKGNGRALVMLLSPGAVLTDDLAIDTLLLDEPLPSADDLARIVKEAFANAGLPEPSESDTRKAVDALIGLAAFPAEQCVSMSLTKKGVDFEGLWERKRQTIEQAPGLSVWRGGESFDNIGGCSNVKKFLGSVVTGAEPPRVVVFIDEIEKAFAGFGTDTSGVKTEMTGTMLTEMQDKEYDGAIFIGPPGAAKSAVAKAFGNTAGVPTIAFDLSAMQASLVGESGARLRAALKIVAAVSQGRAFFIATCNSIGSLPPELRRRFTAGTFFFDLPSAEERGRIWSIYQTRYGVSGELPNDAGWTGAEIKECCRKASKLSISLIEAATYIVPVSISASEQINTLRAQASGKFISASEPGLYSYDAKTPAGAGRAVLTVQATSKRKIGNFND